VDVPLVLPEEEPVVVLPEPEALVVVPEVEPPPEPEVMPPLRLVVEPEVLPLPAVEPAVLPEPDVEPEVPPPEVVEPEVLCALAVAMLAAKTATITTIFFIKLGLVVRGWIKSNFTI
jgi:hypothetical protein